MPKTKRKLGAQVIADIGSGNLLSSEEQQRADKLREVQTQLEFYFGDANLRKDGFTRKLVGPLGTDYLPVDTLLQFNKLATLTGGNKVKVVEAASASSMLQVSEDHASIKRVKPLPQDDSNSMAVIERTVYLEGFDVNWSVDVLIEEISHVYQRPVFVSLPKAPQSRARSKGFAFVEFETEALASRFVQTISARNSPDPKSQSGGEPWKGMPKVEWLAMKEDYASLQKYFHRLEQEVRKDLQNREQTSSQEESSSGKHATPMPGSIVHGIRLREGVSKQSVRSLLSRLGCVVQYIEFDEAGSELFARCAAVDEAAWEAKEAMLQTILGEQAMLEVLEGAEEIAYWDRVGLAKKLHSAKLKDRFEMKKDIHKANQAPHNVVL